MSADKTSSSGQQGAVEGLKNKLYSRKNAPVMRDVRAPLTPSDTEVPVAWPAAPDMPPRQPQPYQPTYETRMSFAAKFFIGSVIFFFVAAAAAVLMFFYGGNSISPRNIDLQIVAPSLVDSGKDAMLEIIINNRNQAELQLVDLVIDYPEGTRNPKDPTQALSHARQSLGAISAGQTVKRTASALFFGAAGAREEVRARIEYSVAGSNAIFTKEGTVTLTIGSSPVSLHVEMPTEAIAGEAFTLAVTAQSNAAETINDVVLEGQYPFGFSIMSAAPKASVGSALWRLGAMKPGETKTVTLTGVIDGQDGDQRVFKFLVGSDSDTTNTSIRVPFLTMPSSLTVKRPFITASLAVGGQSGSAITAAAGREVQGVITWQNNLQDTVSDLKVTLSLAGATLDRSSINPGNGFYQSSNSTITWTSAENPALAQVPPGGSGQLQFSFATLPPGSGGVVYANPTVDLGVSVEATRPGQDAVPEKISSAAAARVSFATAVALSAQSLRNSGPFANEGPIPPRAETPTTYTVMWTVKNTSNTVANASVSTVLPLYVNFKAAQAGSGIVYDANTRTVRWNLGDIKAGAGYSVAAQQASFQVTLLPSLSQVGAAPALTGAARLSGEDRFAEVEVSATADSVTTRTVDAGNGMDIVAPKQ